MNRCVLSGFDSNSLQKNVRLDGKKDGLKKIRNQNQSILCKNVNNHTNYSHIICKLHSLQAWLCLEMRFRVPYGKCDNDSLSLVLILCSPTKLQFRGVFFLSLSDQSAFLRLNSIFFSTPWHRFFAVKNHRKKWIFSGISSFWRKISHIPHVDSEAGNTDLKLFILFLSLSHSHSHRVHAIAGPGEFGSITLNPITVCFNAETVVELQITSRTILI